MSPGDHVTARLQVLGAAVLFSTGGAAIKATTLTGWQVASFRSAVAALAVLLLLRGARRRWTWRIALVSAAYAATLVLFVLGTKLTTSANTIFLQSTAPLYLVVLGPWLLKESPRRGDVLFMVALALGLGLLFIGSPTPTAIAPRPVLGNVLAAGSGFAWAFTVIGLRWTSRRDHEAPGSAAAAVVCGNVIACALCLPWALPVASPAVRDALLVAYLGVVQIGLAYALLTFAFRHVPALEASLLLLTEPVLNPIWTWLVHGERPGPWSLAGGAIILGATGVQAAASARAQPTVPRAA